MRPLAWLLTHLGSTVCLAGLDRELRAELSLRATSAACGRPSPHQLPPTGALLILAAFVAIVFFFS